MNCSGDKEGGGGVAVAVRGAHGGPAALRTAALALAWALWGTLAELCRHRKEKTLDALHYIHPPPPYKT